MGVHLSNIVEGREIGLDYLFDKTIAIDAFNWLHQFLSIIRQVDGEPLKDTKGRVTSHLSGLFYRTMKLLEAGINPAYVFDGKPPEFKMQEVSRRRDIRAEAVKEWKKALEAQDFEAAKKYAMRSTMVTGEIVDDAKKLLDAMGIPAVQAASEGEALCAVMCRKGDVWASATQDYDSLLFGSPRLIRNLSITGKKKRGSEYVTINPELLVLKDVLEKLEINQKQLIITGILIGTDYNQGGVQGLGPKKALELVREKKTLEKIMEGLIWDFDMSAREIYKFFMEPDKTQYEIKFGKPDAEKIKRLMCDEHDFSEERIDNALSKLEEKKGEQKSLSRWLKK